MIKFEDMRNVFILIIANLAVFLTDLNAQECNYRINEINEAKGIEKKITNGELFIAETDSSLLDYNTAKGENNFELHINSANFTNLKILYINIIIDSNKAHKNLGRIRKNAEFLFKLANGKTIILKSSKSNRGDAVNKKNRTYYSPYFVLDEVQYQTLLNNTVDIISIPWSKGHKDYSVTYPAVLAEQLRCIE
jgi:hypothetical protein